MTARVPNEKWTDEEWLRVLREFPPGAPVDDAERAVARWRLETKDDPHGN
jgi:hypothetical protein